MSDLEDFLAWVQTEQRQAELDLFNGDAEPRLELWSANEPVTLFGAWRTDSGRDDVTRTFLRLADTFSDCTGYERDIVAAGVSGDLAYTVSHDRMGVSIDGTPSPHVLRVTQVYRREDGQWRVVHRHADPPPDPSMFGTTAKSEQ